MTSALVNKFQSLAIEDLNVKGMMAGLTPKAQADSGMGEIKRQLLYKGQVASLHGGAGRQVLPIEQDLLRLRGRERETQA